MEQIRLVLAVVLSIVVFLIWDFMFIQDPARHPSRQPDQQQEAAPVDSTRAAQPFTAQESLHADPDPLRPQEPAVVDQPLRTAPVVTVETNLYSLDISESGARFTRFDLKHYKESNHSEAPQKTLLSEKNNQGTLAFEMEDSGVSGVKEWRFRSDAQEQRVLVSGSPRTISFVGSGEKGLVVEKRYSFYPDSYQIKLDVVVQNRTGRVLAGRPALSLTRFYSDEGSRFVFEGPSAYVDQRLSEIKIKDIEEKRRTEGAIEWVALQNRYFMSCIMPDMKHDAAMSLSSTLESGGRLVSAQYQMPHDIIAQDAAKSYGFNVFLGPKDLRTLKSIGFNLDKAVRFGWFDFVAKPFLWLMNWIYHVIPNYGVAIIILTVIIKLIFWPLGNKSYKSMAEMKKIQPLMMEIREKYKDDKKKMNEEMMSLYKTYKVNPLGGCLPMLVQIPVFIAFYRMLYQSIELRHAPFMLWISDLSAPERLFSFDVAMPLMQPPIGIPVLTILMGATMFLQQKLQPMPGDPAQAKIMMFMPVFLTLIFINFPSGLVLYFIVNNLVSVGQQYLVTRKNN